MTANPATVVTDLSRYAALRTQAKTDQAAATKAAAKEFEAIFIQMMLKSARDATPQSGLFDSQGMSFAQDMFDSQISLVMAEHGGFGMEAVLDRQLGVAPEDLDPSRELNLPARREFPLLRAPLGLTAHPEFLADRTSDSATAPDDDAAGLDDSTVDAPAGAELGFTRALRRHAARAAAKLGTTPDILIAQAALETGWGRHMMHNADGTSANNLFSIKADPGWQGKTVDVRTTEFFGAKPVHVNAAFRAYGDLSQSFDDYVRLLENNPRYQRAIDRAADPKAFVTELQRAGYATDPKYAQKVLEIHKRLAASDAPVDVSSL
ncbi:MAG: flagellar assembly peptidoglycan hydrolase FlgJ [Gammaproteobacteria bacterium]|nr:flagellar assembly peptidoglycan hydrolase FlgJ [Gammaproteobacteria bacterium]